MSNYKFALVGCGRISGKHIDAISEIENTSIVSVCDIDIDNAKIAAEKIGNINFYSSYDEMLQNEEIDIVSILTPSGLHAKQTIDIVNKTIEHKFEVIDVFCLIDPDIILDAIDSYESIKQQIRYSNIFIINRIDVYQNQSLREEISKAILELNPNAKIFETNFGKIKYNEIISEASYAPPPPEDSTNIPNGGPQKITLESKSPIDFQKFKEFLKFMVALLIYNDGSHVLPTKGSVNIPGSLSTCSGSRNSGIPIVIAL